MKLKIDLNTMFLMFNKINDMLGKNELLEISVKQHQITLSSKQSNVFYFSDILNLTHDVLINPTSSYVTTFNDDMFIIIEDIPDDIGDVQSDFKEFINVIRFMANHICTCPALEYVISNQYIKCFLDKSGLKLSEIKELENLFGAECTLEVNGPRAYALFVNDHIE